MIERDEHYACKPRAKSKTSKTTVTVEVSKEREADKGAWAKCSVCSHCWIVIYYPMNLEKFAEIIKKNSNCPKCGKPGMIAKQKDGALKEPVLDRESS